MLEEVIVEPVVEPLVEPVVEEHVVTEPVGEPVVEPVVEEPVVTESAVEEPVVTESATETLVEPAVEPVVEPVVNTLIINTLVELLKKSLENGGVKNKLYISLTPEVTSVINNIVTLTPDTFNDIEKAILEVIKDGKIDSKDIPNLIIIVQKLYQVIYSLKTIKVDSKKRAEIAASLLKYIINILVVERIIKIDEEKQSEFYLQVNTLIDSCISLLNFSKTIKTKGCLKSIFG
jgi:hypothetical protein